MPIISWLPLRHIGPVLEDKHSRPQPGESDALAPDLMHEAQRVAVGRTQEYDLSLLSLEAIDGGDLHCRDTVALDVRVRFDEPFYGADVGIIWGQPDEIVESDLRFRVEVDG